MRPTLRARRWAHFDMHHVLWEPALGPERFFELYCETWRRSVLNLRGRKSLWQWLREVDPRNAWFLLRALRRTQRMMHPAHYLAEYDLAPSAEAVTARMPVARVTVDRPLRRTARSAKATLPRLHGRLRRTRTSRRSSRSA